MAAIDLINAQSKAMREVLNESLEFERQQLSKQLACNIEQQVTMELLKTFIMQIFIPCLKESKEKILSAVAEDNSTWSLMILDLLSAQLPIEEVGHLRMYMPSFFASETYKQTQDKKEMFDSTQSDERNIRSFRANSAYALVAGLFLITFTGMLAAAVALVAFVNPVAGFVILGLAVAFSLYFGNNRLLDLMARLEKHCDLAAGLCKKIFLNLCL